MCHVYKYSFVGCGVTVIADVEVIHLLCNALDGLSSVTISHWRTDDYSPSQLCNTMRYGERLVSGTGPLRRVPLVATAFSSKPIQDSFLVDTGLGLHDIENPASGSAVGS